MRRLAVLVALGSLGCGSRPGAPGPQSMTEALARFFAAVQANDLERMGTLWGTERGPAAQWMKADELHKRLAVIQKYLTHDGYRVAEGPLPVPGHDNQRTLRIELQRAGCNMIQPIDLIRAKSGAWLVYDVHLESLRNPVVGCKPPPPARGTGP